jgi:ferritin-like metal-binding protein YciE
LHQNIDGDVIDAVIIGCVQKIEHYEICTYGTALAYAHELHLHKAAQLLKESLDEEYDADDLLTALATAAVNKHAAPEKH